MFLNHFKIGQTLVKLLTDKGGKIERWKNHQK